MSADIQDGMEDAMQHPATVALMNASIGHNLIDVSMAAISVLASTCLLQSKSIEEADVRLTALIKIARKEMHMNKDVLLQFQERKNDSGETVGR